MHDFRKTCRIMNQHFQGRRFHRHLHGMERSLKELRHFFLRHGLNLNNVKDAIHWLVALNHFPAALLHAAQHQQQRQRGSRASIRFHQSLEEMSKLRVRRDAVDLVEHQKNAFDSVVLETALDFGKKCQQPKWIGQLRSVLLQGFQVDREPEEILSADIFASQLRICSDLFGSNTPDRMVASRMIEATPARLSAPPSVA